MSNRDGGHTKWVIALGAGDSVTSLETPKGYFT